jgi:hypothetical protein
LVCQRKNKSSPRAAASDPSEKASPLEKNDEEFERMMKFLESLPLAELDRPVEELFDKYRRDLARRVYSIPEPDEYQIALRNVKERIEQNKQIEKSVKRVLEEQRKERTSAIPSVKELKRRRSISQVEAAKLLCCTKRTIRNRTNAKKLTLTPAKRVVIDDNFTRLYRRLHGEGVLH